MRPTHVPKQSAQTSRHTLPQTRVIMTLTGNPSTCRCEASPAPSLHIACPVSDRYDRGPFCTLFRPHCLRTPYPQKPRPAPQRGARNLGAEESASFSVYSSSPYIPRVPMTSSPRAAPDTATDRLHKSDATADFPVTTALYIVRRRGLPV